MPVCHWSAIWTEKVCFWNVSEESSKNIAMRLVIGSTPVSIIHWNHFRLFMSWVLMHAAANVADESAGVSAVIFCAMMVTFLMISMNMSS